MAGGLTKFYDLRWEFADGQVVTFAGISRIQDIRKRLKALKRLPHMQDYARKLTRKAFAISDHPHCPDCQPCLTCKRPGHACDGHDG